MIRKAIIISVSGTSLTKEESSIIKKEKPWGIILFRRNISSKKQVIDLINSIKNIMRDKKYPILIDEEGGRVSRFSNFLDNSHFNQKYFGNIYKKNKSIGYAIYQTYINSLSEVFLTIGANINTVPVLDLIKENKHQIVGNRSFSSNVNIVKELGANCVKFYKKNKIATVIKHIPGHGSAKSDSHFKLPKVNDSHKLLKKDFSCFKNSSSFFAMTAHILYSKIDSKKNTTHSKIIINKIIRKEIGFKGILISDDISMKALKYSLRKNAKLALEAGCNLVLYCAGKTKEMKKLLRNIPNIDKFTEKKTSTFYRFLS